MTDKNHLLAYKAETFGVEVVLIGSFGCNLRFENKRNLFTNNAIALFITGSFLNTGAKITSNRLPITIISIFFIQDTGFGSYE